MLVVTSGPRLGDLESGVAASLLTVTAAVSAGGLLCLVGVGVVGCLVLSLALTLVMHRTDWLYPQLALVAGEPTAVQPYPLRRLDPTCRLRGWKELGQEVDRVCAELRERGIDPVIVGSGWSLPGLLGVYCAGQPETYSVGAVCGDRHSQYDFWDGPVTRPERFRERTFVCVGGISDTLKAGFASVDPTRLFVHTEAGYPVAAWGITILRDFRGFPTGAEAARGH